MTSESEPLWPYLLLAAGWSAVCGGLLLRSRKAKAAPEPVADDSELSSLEQAPWERDTQAGRM